MNKIRFVTLMVFLIILSGCATAMLATMPVNNSSTIREFLHDDSITAVGQGQERDNIILFGEQNTYMITKGSSELKKLFKLDANRITFNEDREINFDVTENKFSTVLMVRYYTDGQIASEDLQVMRDVGFQQSSMTPRGLMHVKSLSASGTIYAKNNEQVGKKNLKYAREVKIYSIMHASEVDPKRALDMVAALPLTVTFDIITLPLQLILLTSQNH